MYVTGDLPNNLDAPSLNFGRLKRLPIVLQTESAECGLACVAMIASFFGHETDLNSLRQRFSFSSHGATLKQIIEICASLKLNGRALKLDVEHLSELETPCILHWEMKHFVVLKAVKRDHVIIHDPAFGVKTCSIKEVSDLFTGIALELTPTHEFQAKTEKSVLQLNQLWHSIRGVKRSLILLITLSFLLQFFAILSPYYVQLVVDDVLLRSDTNLLKVLAAAFVFLLLIEVFTSYCRQTLILSLASKLNLQMGTNLFDHLIRLPVDYFIKRHMGDIVSRFSSLQQVRELLTNGIVSVAIDGVMALIMLAIMFIYSTTLGFVVLTVSLTYAVLRMAFFRPFRQLNEEKILAAAQENSHFMETVRAIQTIKLFSREALRQNQWQNKLVKCLNKEIQIAQYQINFSVCNRILFGLENIAIIYLGAMAVMDSLLSVGMLLAFISYKTKFIDATDKLIVKWIEFKMLGLHLERLSDIVFSPKDHYFAKQNEPLQNAVLDNPEISGALRVRNLSYSYSSIDSPVFENLSFDIHAGETVAIVGASGIGKSTLLRCLMSLLSGSTGEVLADNRNIEELPNYRKQIAGVLQDDQLMEGSIADNISCFDTTPDMNWLIECAKVACVHEEIMQSSMQYNTLVGDMGDSLSGGQKQRILLARALYRRPKIIFMDEATSHLDIDNEALINRHIKALNMTRIVIAHRPQTIGSADRVYEMQRGALREVNFKQGEYYDSK